MLTYVQILDQATGSSAQLHSVIAHCAEWLTDENYGGFSREHCQALSNCSQPGELGKVLAEAAEQATDVLLVYYSGHGFADQSDDGIELLLPLPGTDYDEMSLTALHYLEIRRKFRRSRAKLKILIVDCCFSGLAIGTPLSGVGIPADDVIEIHGAAILASSSEMYRSLSPENAVYTA